MYSLFTQKQLTNILSIAFNLFHWSLNYFTRTSFSLRAFLSLQLLPYLFPSLSFSFLIFFLPYLFPSLSFSFLIFFLPYLFPSYLLLLITLSPIFHFQTSFKSLHWQASIFYSNKNTPHSNKTLQKHYVNTIAGYE